MRIWQRGRDAGNFLPLSGQRQQKLAADSIAALPMARGCQAKRAPGHHVHLLISASAARCHAMAAQFTRRETGHSCEKPLVERCCKQPE